MKAPHDNDTAWARADTAVDAATTDRRARDIQVELFQGILRPYRVMPALIPALAGTSALLLETAWPPVFLAAWWLALSVTYAEYAFFHRRMERALARSSDDVDRWINACAVRYWIANLLWIGLLPLFWVPGAEAQNLFLLFVLTSHVVVAALTSYPVLRICISTTLPVALSGFVAALVVQERLIILVECVVMIAYIYLLVSTSAMRRSSAERIQLRLRNSMLIEDLARAKEHSDEARRRAEQAATQLKQREAYSRALIENAFDSILITDKDGQITYASPATKQLGFAPHEMLGLNVLDFVPPDRAEELRTDGRDQVDRANGSFIFVESVSTGDGRAHWVEASVTDLRTDPNVNGYVLNIRDITQRKRADEELRSHFQLLESLAHGAPLGKMLEDLAKRLEQSNTGARAAVLLVSDEDELEVAAAPSMPPLYNDAINGLGLRVTPSGTAIRTGAPVIAENAETQIDLPRYRTLARKLHITSCWAQPIFSRNGRPLGAVAMYFGQERTPSSWESHVLSGAAHLAGIAIDRRREDAALRQATETAEMASRAKSKFLATMSHELRTPLNAIIGFSEIMKNEIFGPLNNEHYTEYASDIYDSGAHLLSVIDDILDISKIEAGRYKIEETDVDMRDVVDWTVEMVNPRTSEKRQRVTIAADSDLPMVYADKRALRQIMLNLLSNASKFTPDEGWIEVRIESSLEGGISVAVSDTGIGIPAEKLREVLEPFGQVDDEAARQHPGTGLGLPITKSLIEMHQGTFNLDSELGTGTIASFILPAERVRSQAVVADEQP